MTLAGKSGIRAAIEKIVDERIKEAEVTHKGVVAQLAEDFKAAIILAERRAVEQVLKGLASFTA